jgi:CBS domain-containing protein
MATTVRKMIEGKHEIHAVPPDATVLDALGLMAEKNIGAVIVMSSGELRGIFTERDYARKVVLQGKSSRDTPISDVMTVKLVTVEPSATVEECMSLMDERHVRHLPVVSEGQVIGVISIRAVVQAVLAEHRHTIRHLENYISAGA